MHITLLAGGAHPDTVEHNSLFHNIISWRSGMWCHQVIVWFSGIFVCIPSVVILKKQNEDYRYKSPLLPLRFPSTSSLCSAARVGDQIIDPYKTGHICCLDLYTSRQCIYNVTLKCIHATIVAVEKQYYIFWVCVCMCSLKLSSMQFGCAVFYCYLGWLYHTFPHYWINDTIPLPKSV